MRGRCASGVKVGKLMSGNGRKRILVCDRSKSEESGYRFPALASNLEKRETIPRRNNAEAQTRQERPGSLGDWPRLYGNELFIRPAQRQAGDDIADSEGG